MTIQFKPGQFQPGLILLPCNFSGRKRLVKVLFCLPVFLEEKGLFFGRIAVPIVVLFALNVSPPCAQCQIDEDHNVNARNDRKNLQTRAQSAFHLDSTLLQLGRLRLKNPVKQGGKHRHLDWFFKKFHHIGFLAYHFRG